MLWHDPSGRHLRHARPAEARGTRCSTWVGLIIHAGDVCKPEILKRLREIAPVVAVRGNVDTAPWAEELPETQVLRVAGRNIYVLHDRARLVVDPVTVWVCGRCVRPLTQGIG